MNKFKATPWKSQCPQCKTYDRVYIYDKGLKFLYRFILGNNRFACRKCKITWRRKIPFDFMELKKR